LPVIVGLDNSTKRPADCLRWRLLLRVAYICLGVNRDVWCGVTFGLRRLFLTRNCKAERNRPRAQDRMSAVGVFASPVSLEPGTDPADLDRCFLWA
jgi:hypothetical protein